MMNRRGYNRAREREEVDMIQMRRVESGEERNRPVWNPDAECLEIVNKGVSVEAEGTLDVMETC